MRNNLIKPLSLALALGCSSAYAEKTDTIDLGTAASVANKNGANKKYEKVKLINLVPRFNYSFTYELTEVPVAAPTPVTLPSNEPAEIKNEPPKQITPTGPAATPGGVAAFAAVPHYSDKDIFKRIQQLNEQTLECKTLKVAVKGLNEVENETLVAAKSTAYLNARKTWSGNSGRKGDPTLTALVNKLVALANKPDANGALVPDLNDWDVSELEEKFFNIGTCAEALETGERLYARTTVEYGIEIEDGYSTNVKISRQGDSEADKKEWAVTYKGEAKGTLLTSISYLYGFGTTDDYYYTDKIAGLTDTQTDHYAVFRGDNNSEAFYSPSIMATYVPSTGWNQWIDDTVGFNLAFSFGIAVDNTKPGVLVGLSGVFGDNIVLTYGYGLFAAKDLYGKFTSYEKTDEVTTTTEVDGNSVTTVKTGIVTLPDFREENELLRDVYKGSTFVSIGFMFELN